MPCRPRCGSPRTASPRCPASSPASAAGPASPVEPGPQSLTSAQRRELAELYNSGIQAAESGRTEDAVNYWELVWSADPGYGMVAEYLKREYLARGMEYFADGRLDDAVRDWEQALRIDPDDERATGYLKRVRQQQNRMREISTN